MIKYQLNCKKCHKTFDSWFASSREFEKLKTDVKALDNVESDANTK